jgi:hypothetical protein
MNYLALTNALKTKCGVSGSDLTTIVGVTGEPGRLASWINEAYLNIQLVLPTWNWMRNSFSFQTTTGKYSYSATDCGVTDYGFWKIDSLRRYITSVGVRSEIHVTPMHYDSWRDTYLFGNMRLSYSDPLFVAEGPDMSLNFGMIPGDVGYTIVGEYYKTPSVLAADTDTPSMPDRYHMVIVYRAMMMYGMYEAAPEVVQEGTALYNAMLRRLIRDQNSDITVGSALA